MQDDVKGADQQQQQGQRTPGDSRPSSDASRFKALGIPAVASAARYASRAAPRASTTAAKDPETLPAFLRRAQYES